MGDLGQIFKAYDVRGTVPDTLTPDVARRIGAAFAHHTAAERIVVAHDMRPSSPELATAFSAGVNSQGVDVLAAGLGSTDLLYFASGYFEIPGAMFTASHNPAQYNGIKMCHARAAPIGSDSGLAEIRSHAETGLAPAERVGAVTERDLLADYAQRLRSLVDLSGIRPLRVVVDAANGMAGHTVPAVLGSRVLDSLPLEIVPLYFELDGTFPNHPADPMAPENLVDLQRAVRANNADVGLAFDGDADRCFVVDEQGNPVTPSTVTALVAVRELDREPGATVIHNLITSRAVPELIREHGGYPVRTRVGHSFVKAQMAQTNAVFGGEHSAHYYFRDFWRADTGMLAALHVLAALGNQQRPLSQLTAEFARYAASGEINSTVADPAQRTREVEAEFAGRPGAEVDHLDGLTVSFTDGRWFNLRASNTEPLLRLNVEAPTVPAMEQLRDEVLAVVRSEG
ncbi:phosphomannomutase/phosphoglucomutase [Lipingzhangella sp. LS1_29]|uniref:Phosphomannomutase/phosphoglucomutase n=1 Tax=Lipingzhangella rawalii TaxID=2055835 RepID=A0ABU2H506_9ACTN|nr:phosphomannomutase/phosphoglucomutase [Lipingzhangella rawalii]MDS1270388.1 phosphomannomutase/phosphoglucomutase [Lipingzhangella rawalii]